MKPSLFASRRTMRPEWACSRRVTLTSRAMGSCWTCNDVVVLCRRLHAGGQTSTVCEQCGTLSCNYPAFAAFTAPGPRL